MIFESQEPFKQILHFFSFNSLGTRRVHRVAEQVVIFNKIDKKEEYIS